MYILPDIESLKDKLFENEEELTRNLLLDLEYYPPIKFHLNNFIGSIELNKNRDLKRDDLDNINKYHKLFLDSRSFINCKEEINTKIDGVVISINNYNLDDYLSSLGNDLIISCIFPLNLTQLCLEDCYTEYVDILCNHIDKIVSVRLPILYYPYYKLIVSHNVKLNIESLYIFNIDDFKEVYNNSSVNSIKVIYLFETLENEFHIINFFNTIKKMILETNNDIKLNLDIKIQGLSSFEIDNFILNNNELYEELNSICESLYLHS